MDFSLQAALSQRGIRLLDPHPLDPDHKYFATYEQSNTPCCISIYRGADSLDRGRKEWEALSPLQHPNILRVYDHFEWQDGLVLVTETFQKSLLQDIHDRKRNRYTWREEELWALIRYLIDAFAYMERLRVAHRDINPDCILLDIQKRLIISELYTSKIVPFTGVHTVTGTFYYFSPILRDALAQMNPNVQHNAYKSDVYSLGMTLLVMSSLEFPQALTSGEGEAGLQQVISSLNYSEFLKILLRWMLTHDEAGRPTFLEIKSWLNSATEHTLQAPAREISPQMVSGPAGSEEAPLLPDVPDADPPAPQSQASNSDPSSLASRPERGVNRSMQSQGKSKHELVSGSCFCSNCRLF